MTMPLGDERRDDEFDVEPEDDAAEAVDDDRGEHAFDDDGYVDDDAEADEPESAPRPAPQEIEIMRTPQGAKRGGITESEEIDYRNPPPKLLRPRQRRRDRGPDRREMEKTARALLEVARATSRSRRS